MGLRYTNAPDIDTSKWTPSVEFMLSGVQQAQQRHDLNQANWQKTIEEGLSKGYIDAKSRETYIKDLEKLNNDKNITILNVYQDKWYYDINEHD